MFYTNLSRSMNSCSVYVLSSLSCIFFVDILLARITIEFYLILACSNGRGIGIYLPSGHILMSYIHIVCGFIYKISVYICDLFFFIVRIMLRILSGYMYLENRSMYSVLTQSNDVGNIWPTAITCLVAVVM